MMSDKIRRNAFCHVDENGRWQKIEGKVLWWHRSDTDRNIICITLKYQTARGTGYKLIKAREHFIAKGWFATRDGRVLHYTKQHGLNESMPQFVLPEKRHATKNGVTGNRLAYLSAPRNLRYLLPSVTFHVFIYECWYGARTPGKQIDHINGIELDNRICNLQEVTPEENQYRGIVLDSMHKAHNVDGLLMYKMEYFEKEPFRLIEIFDKYRPLYRPKTNNDELKLAINPSYNTRNHCHGVVIENGKLKIENYGNK